MANVIGVRPTEAITEDFGGIVQQGIAQINQQRELERQRQQQEQDRLSEFQDKYALPEELLHLDTTEFRSVNDASVEAVAQYRDRYYDVFKQLQNDPTNLQLKKRLSSLKSGIMQLKSVHGKMKGLGEQYLEAVANDQVSEVQAERWRQELEAYDEGKVRVRVNDNDHLELLTYDKEGKLVGVKDYRSLLNDSLMKRNDIHSELDTMAKRLGAEKKTFVEGDYLVTKNVFGDKQKMAAAREIDAYVTNDETMADLYQQLIDNSSRRESGFTDEERASVKGALLQRLEDRYGETVDLQANPVALQRMRAAEARAAREQDREDKEGKPDIVAATKNGQPQIDNEGNFVFALTKATAIDPAKSDTRIDVLKGTADGMISLEGQGREKVKDVPEGATLEEVRALNNDASIFAEQTGPDKVTYYKNVPFSIEYDPNGDNDTTRKVINSFAARAGFTNEDGLRDAMYDAFVKQFGAEKAVEFFSEDKKKAAQAKRSTAQETAQETAQGEAPAETVNFEGMTKEQLRKLNASQLSPEQKKAYYLALAKAK